jgi:hypothetical protein
MHMKLFRWTQAKPLTLESLPAEELRHTLSSLSNHLSPETVEQLGTKWGSERERLTCASTLQSLIARSPEMVPLLNAQFSHPDMLRPSAAWVAQLAKLASKGISSRDLVDFARVLEGRPEQMSQIVELTLDLRERSLDNPHGSLSFSELRLLEVNLQGREDKLGWGAVRNVLRSDLQQLAATGTEDELFDSVVNFQPAPVDSFTSAR